jgi:hypothetical protein
MTDLLATARSRSEAKFITSHGVLTNKRSDGQTQFTPSASPGRTESSFEVASHVRILISAGSRREIHVSIAAVRRMLALPFLFCALTGLARAQETTRKASDEAAKAEVLKVEQQFSEAAKAKDQVALERILADRLSWVARGDRLNKAQVIADYLSENLHFKYFAHDSVAVNTFGNTAVVTGHSTSVLEYKGKVFDAPRLFTDVFVKMGGRWQLVCHQVSELAKP